MIKDMKFWRKSISKWRKIGIYGMNYEFGLNVEMQEELIKIKECVLA